MYVLRSCPLSVDRVGAAAGPRRRRSAPFAAGAWLATWLLAACLPAAAQVGTEDEPLLPDAISSDDLTLRGRYARQWKRDDGTLVVVFNGGFRLDLGKRRLSADNAVVWIEPKRTEREGRKYYELTAYLSGRAVVHEPAGTITEDSVLLVSNLRTFGRIIKLHDAHSPEVMESSAFYEQAVQDRARIRQATTAPVAGTPAEQVEIARPRDVERRPRPPRMLTYQFGNIEPAQTPAGEMVQVISDGVYLAQVGTPDAPALEIRSDNAVVFLAPGAAAAAILGEQPPAPRAAQPSEPPEPTEPADAPQRRAREKDEQETPFSQLGKLQAQIRAVYLEGDVVLSLGTRFVRASRIYYDFEQDRALILDGVLRADLPGRDVPVYVRADEIRQLSAREFSARNARVSTSEFYQPHYHVGVGKVLIRDRTGLSPTGRPVSQIAGSYELTNSTLNVEGLPLLWWPYSKGDYSSSETLIRGVKIGHDDDFGTQFRSRWYLFNLLGIGPPPGYDATLDLDYLSDRGPGIGIDLDYQRDDHFGLWRSYYIHDDGEDNLGLLRDNVPDTDERGRILWRHRQYLPNDWQATVELSYISDPGFLEEFEKSEWFESKEQETLVYLKRAKETDAITLLANWRLLDFVTQTEHLPDLTYRRIGDSLLDGWLVFYHESRIGAVRRRPDDRHLIDEPRYQNDGRTDVNFRADFREEVELPIKFAGLNIVPFASFRGSYWDGQPLDTGGLWRGLGVYGVRGGAYLARVYDDVESELFDIHRIRHIVRPHFVAWWAHSNTRSEYITPFDEGIETVDDFHGAAFGVKQTWQTKRGGEDRQRTVDLLTFDLEAGFFGDRQSAERSNGYANTIRPEDSRTRNYLAGDVVYRMSDTTSLLYEFNIDVNNWSFDRHNVSIAVERLPRLAYVFGWRHAGDINLDLVGGGYNYKLSEKHITAVRAWYDVDRGQLGEVAFSYIRRLPRWYLGFVVEVDQVFDDVSFSVSMWPEGIPEWTLGSRRFTGLATTTGIRP